MEENIYRLLNEVETDFSEYEDVKLSSGEMEQRKQNILKEVRRMEPNAGKTAKRRRGWKTAAGVAAAFALAISANAADTVTAENMFSGIFGQLIDNARGQKYEKEDAEMFTSIGKNSVSVKDEVKKHKSDVSYNTETADNGVTVSVSDIYCDGYILYYTSTLKTNNKDLNKADGIISSAADGAYFQELKINGMDTGYSSRSFQKAKDGSFVAVNQIDLLDMEEGSGNKTAVVDWTLKKLSGNLFDQWDEDGEYVQTGSVEGEWHLKFPVTIDRSKNETFKINKGQNGFIVKKAVKTKSGLLVEIEIPDMDKEPYENMDMGIADAQGNWLRFLAMKTIPREGGSALCQVMALYDGQKDLSFRAASKEEQPAVLADIDFQIP